MQANRTDVRADTTATVRVYLDPDELGEAFANRSIEDQVAILRTAMLVLGKQGQADVARLIGWRLFALSSDSATMDVINFLRAILNSCASKAEKLRAAATPPEAQS